ncbi:MAG: hypothetical protein IJX17_00090 [Clostridia bacterium]|nr:hypothetical protein [Clostridia bacterium]
MLVETIKDYTDKETKLVFKTTDNCTIRRVSDVRGAELIAAGVVVEVKPEDEVKSEVETKSKSKSKKKDEVNAEDKTPEDVFVGSNGNFEDESVEETSGDTQSE